MIEDENKNIKQNNMENIKSNELNITERHSLVQVDVNDKNLYKHVLEIRDWFTKEFNSSVEYLNEDDEKTLLYVLFSNDIPFATGRIFEKEDGFKLERIVVIPTERSKGIGKLLVKEMISICRLKNKDKKIYLNANKLSKGFYLKLGFKSEGESFMEDGVELFKVVL